MDRQAPRAISSEIDLYIRTYYSLLRSSGDVRVRAFEEAHLYSRSSLHTGAIGPDPDLSAFAYSAARLPECMPRVRRVVLGQSLLQFEKAGLPVASWQAVRTRGRRRPLRWDGAETLAVFVASASDIDDLVPIVTAYQIEWNKLGRRLRDAGVGHGALPGDDVIADQLGGAESLLKLRGALGTNWREVLPEIAARECDMFLRLLDGSFREYQRSAQRWWRAIEPYKGSPDGERPIYFVSSNSHSLANLLGGYARIHSGDVIDWTRETNPEGLREPLDQMLAAGDDDALSNLLYYLLRGYLHDRTARDDRMPRVQEFDAESGIWTIGSPARIDVDAQVIDLSRLKPERVDPRLRITGLEKLVASRALIINIDYPLGMAAYHHGTAVTEGVDEIRGMYIMGKAATLNGRVGDVMISKVVHDEHSQNTYLFRNALVAGDVQPYMHHGTVLDNQKALTVRSAFLQNREYMDVFYREGYTVMEMEAGPYLSALVETTSPQRHPQDEIVQVADHDFEIGVIHYASDTPYSRRQTLLSKSLSYFGVESTYACAIAIARRILTAELARLGRAGS